MLDLFVKLEKYGRLYIEKILFESNYPILFTCINQEKNRFLCVCCQNNEKGKKWLITKATSDTILSMLKDEISIREAFLKDKTCRISLVRKNNKEYSEHDNEDWNENSIYLPKKGEYIEADDEEFSEEIAYFNSGNFPNIIDTNSDTPSSTQRYELKLLILYLFCIREETQLNFSYTNQKTDKKATYTVVKNKEYQIYQENYPLIA